ncbi:MAG: TrmH family RNA methyltransferase [Arachnia sp.]
MVRIEIDQVDDPRVADFVSLRDASLRRRIEPERGIFIAEGATIIQRAVASGCQPRAFLLAERWLPGLADTLAAWPEVTCYVAGEAVIEQISGFHVHRGALGSFRRPEPTPWERFTQARRVIVCESLVDHANIGAIMRTAAALGWDGVLVSPDSADPLYRRAIKASMGASLQVPWRRMERADDLRRLSQAGFTLAATVLSDQALGPEALPAADRLALLVGSEGHGLSAQWRELADVEVSIQMAAGVDSLNVATALGIFAYLLRPGAPR